MYLILALVVTACADEKKETDNNTENELSFSSKTIEKKLNDCKPEEGKCTFISLKFPVAKRGEGQAEVINEHIEKFLQNVIDFQEDGEDIAVKPEDLANNFIANYEKTAADFPEYELPWEATVIGKIDYRSSEIISVKFNTDVFTGGAHGYASTNYLNFDPDSGQELETNELFNEDFIKFVEKDFRKRKDIAAEENINSTGFFFENDEFHLPINIGITRDKVILHYNAYEIAPYSSGNFVMSYPRSEVSQFLKISDK